MKHYVSKRISLIGLMSLLLVGAGWFFGFFESKNARVFDNVSNKLDQLYYDPNMNGMDWAAVKKVYRARARAARSEVELYNEVLSPMLDLLESSHLAVVMPSERWQFQSGPSLEVFDQTFGNCLGVVIDMGSKRIGPRILQVSSSSPLKSIGIAKDWKIDSYWFGAPEPGRPHPVITFLDRTGQSHAHSVTNAGELLPADRDPLRNPDLWDYLGPGMDQASMSIETLGLTVRPGRAQQRPLIAAVWPDGEAFKAGVRLHQRLTSISFKPTDDPAWLNVRMELVEVDGKPVHINRRLFCPSGTTPNVTTRYDGETLYVRFDHFDADAARQLEKLRYLKPKTVVLDLRANSGGSAEAMTKIAGIFLGPTSLIGIATDRAGPEKIYPDKASVQMPGVIYVLTSRATRSSAEVLAAALRLHRHAMIYGDRTAGAVVMSRTYGLPDGGMFQLPVSDFVDGEGKRLERNGVMPDKSLEQEPAITKMVPPIAIALPPRLQQATVFRPA